MIKNAKILKRFESRLSAREKINIRKKYRIFEAMYREAIALGILPSEDPLDGIGDKIRLARKLNRVSKAT